MPPDGVVISDVTLAPGNAFAIWARYISTIFDLEQINGVAREAFFVQNSTLRLANATLLYTRSAPVVLRRSAEKIAASPIEHVSLLFCLSGVINADYDGRKVEMSAGDIVFLDYARPIQQRLSECSSILMLLPRSRMPLLLRQEASHGLKITADLPAARCLTTLAQVLVETVREMTSPEIEAILSSLLAIAQAAWSAAQTNFAPQRDQFLHDRAVAMMRSEAADLSFNPERLARKLGVSRSRLYTLFTAQGGISRAMLNLRLDGSLATLVTGSGNRGVVSEAARALGFQSEAHFSRAFRRKFGFAPSKVVKLMQHGHPTAERDAIADAARRDDLVALAARVSAILEAEKPISAADPRLLRAREGHAPR